MVMGMAHVTSGPESTKAAVSEVADIPAVRAEPSILEFQGCDQLRQYIFDMQNSMIRTNLELQQGLLVVKQDLCKLVATTGHDLQTLEGRIRDLTMISSIRISEEPGLCRASSVERLGGPLVNTPGVLRNAAQASPLPQQRYRTTMSCHRDESMSARAWSVGATNGMPENITWGSHPGVRPGSHEVQFGPQTLESVFAAMQCSPGLYISDNKPSVPLGTSYWLLDANFDLDVPSAPGRDTTVQAVCSSAKDDVRGDMLTYPLPVFVRQAGEENCLYYGHYTVTDDVDHDSKSDKQGVHLRYWTAYLALINISPKVRDALIKHLWPQPVFNTAHVVEDTAAFPHTDSTSGEMSKDDSADLATYAESLRQWMAEVKTGLKSLTPEILMKSCRQGLRLQQFRLIYQHYDQDFVNVLSKAQGAAVSSLQSTMSRASPSAPGAEAPDSSSGHDSSALRLDMHLPDAEMDQGQDLNRSPKCSSYLPPHMRHK